MQISIIIPVLNEEKSIAKFLDYLLATINPVYTKEIIIVDGGSNDNTLEILNFFSNIKIFHSQKGRAIQMNFGAQNALSNVLYFLHCDTFPPIHFDYEIVNHINNGSQSGCFKMKFDNNHMVLKVSQWFTQFNHISCRGGDQSLFVERKLFEQIGGFDQNFLLCEDTEIVSRLYKKSKFTVIQKPVITSARKYLKNGVWKLQFHFLCIHLMFFLNFEHDSIVSYYHKNNL